ncbi:ATP synthase subunit C [Infirmifilum sp. SLHALR2]
MKSKKIALVLLAVNMAVLIASISVLASASTKILQPGLPAQEARPLDLPAALAMLASALAVIGSTIASGIALRSVATAGFAAAAEKPELSTWILIMGGLAEGIAIYGLLVAILILGKI